MENLTGQTIVITGASRGLGKALALRLADEGCNLALLARSEEDLQDLVTEIDEKELSIVAKAYPCDVTNFDQVEQTVENIMHDFTKIDILVNNAGIWHEGPTEKAPIDKIQGVIRTNYEAVVYTCKAVIPYLKKQKHGQIFNIASNAANHPSADWGIYTGSKYAVKGFTESLSLELAKSKIKVSGFYPGGMNTQLFEDYGKKNEPWMMDVVDIVEIITFMLKQPQDVNIGHLQVSKFM